jgi:hypothetical protein
MAAAHVSYHCQHQSGKQCAAVHEKPPCPAPGAQAATFHFQESAALLSPSTPFAAERPARIVVKVS